MLQFNVLRFAQKALSDSSIGHVRAEQFIKPATFRKHVESATLVIAHAGAGSRITAVELGKRIIATPHIGEQKDGRQISTARRFAERGRMAFHECEVLGQPDHLEAADETDSVSARASQDLIASIRAFIETGHYVESASA
jgi:UDP-N-acetylglucosamine transferase subunit ALG13